ncbi:hypothetical protein HPB50_019395 [Hyalomma asiaticum]|uniref:Uncharacterized protein n=1 Tax=Hyalomma asiaticum TaxID=266040 RepID=A0ACB7SIV7_HYAAI|nr:hypothetical protein HPB50_019395 [Hyalomma asiaticum]
MEIRPANNLVVISVVPSTVTGAAGSSVLKAVLGSSADRSVKVRGKSRRWNPSFDSHDSRGTSDGETTDSVGHWYVVNGVDRRDNTLNRIAIVVFWHSAWNKSWTLQTNRHERQARGRFGHRLVRQRHTGDAVTTKFATMPAGTWRQRCLVVMACVLLTRGVINHRLSSDDGGEPKARRGWSSATFWRMKFYKCEGVWKSHSSLNESSGTERTSEAPKPIRVTHVILYSLVGAKSRSDAESRLQAAAKQAENCIKNAVLRHIMSPSPSCVELWKNSSALVAPKTLPTVSWPRRLRQPPLLPGKSVLYDEDKEAAPVFPKVEAFELVEVFKQDEGGVTYEIPCTINELRLEANISVFVLVLIVMVRLVPFVMAFVMKELVLIITGLQHVLSR